MRRMEKSKGRTTDKFEADSNPDLGKKKLGPKEKATLVAKFGASAIFGALAETALGNEMQNSVILEEVEAVEEETGEAEEILEAEAHEEETEVIPDYEWQDAPLSDTVSDEMSFGEAFASARAELGPGGVFQWNGEVYHTFYASELDDEGNVLVEVTHDEVPGSEIDEALDPEDEIIEAEEVEEEISDDVNTANPYAYNEDGIMGIPEDVDVEDVENIDDMDNLNDDFEDLDSWS